jgi:transposase
LSFSNRRKSIRAAADELGIRSDMLSRWKVEFYNHKKEAFPGLGHARKQKDKKLSELQALKKELREVKLERDILKKAISIFSKSDSLDTNS